MYLLFAINIQAQKELDWWYFGIKAGLYFGTTANVVSKEGLMTSKMPIAIEGPIQTYEGCFTLSDVDGNLIMSSDGMNVYDKNNTLMEDGTGLAGNPSATQSGIVIPVPGNFDQYYIFTVNAADGAATGINYSIADLSLNAGLGKIITKNVNIQPGWTGENIAAAAKADGTGYWLVNRTVGNFLVWDITAGGVSGPTLYPSNYAWGTTDSYIGELKFSPDNTKIVNGTYRLGHIISADFDPQTGVISDAKVSGGHGGYGIEFSLSGEYLYIGGESSYGSKISWDDLRLNNPPTSYPFLAVNWSMGPDKRIYGVNRNTRTIYVIMDPEKGGNDVRTFENYLLPGTYAAYGLPNFAASFFSQSEMPAFTCTSYSSSFNIEVTALGTEAPATLEWSFGDGSPIVIQNVGPGTAVYTQNYTYPAPGIYTIVITPKKLDGTPLSKTTHKISISDCVIRTNRVVRHDLKNSVTINFNR